MQLNYLFNLQKSPSDVHLECKEDSPTVFTFDPSKHTPPTSAFNTVQKGHQITKNKVFNFDNYSPIISESESATVRSSIQLEKQQQEQLTQHHQKLPSSHYPFTSYQHNIAMPTLLPSNPPTMPVMISSKVSPSTTSNAFSISELMRKDKSQPAPGQQMVTNSISSSQGVTVLKQQNINININDGRQSVLLFGSSQSQPPSLIRHPSEPNKSGQGLLLIPAASTNGNFHMPSSRPIQMESAFSKYQSPIPISSQFRNSVDEPWNSLRMSGTTNLVTGARSSSAARIRFDDSKTEVLTDRPVKSEPTTPTPGSPWKKSILKRQSNDGMEK